MNLGLATFRQREVTPEVEDRHGDAATAEQIVGMARSIGATSTADGERRILGQEAGFHIQLPTTEYRLCLQGEAGGNTMAKLVRSEIGATAWRGKGRRNNQENNIGRSVLTPLTGDRLYVIKASTETGCRVSDKPRCKAKEKVSPAFGSHSIHEITSTKEQRHIAAEILNKARCARAET